jgi:hypothetical protein
MCASGDRLGSLPPLRIIRKEFRKMMHHRCARTRRTDNCFCIALVKVTNKTLRQLAGLGPVTRVKGGLAAASLPFIKLDFTTQASQNFDSAHPDRAPELIDNTGYE